MTKEQEEEIALLDGKKAKLVYLFLLEVATFLSFLTIAPSWLGVLDPRFIGAWGSVAILQAIPFFVPSKYRAMLSQTIIDSQARERELLERIRTMKDVFPEKPNGPS